MDAYAIKARFEIERPVPDTRRWLTTTEGIAGWWSDSVSGSASAAGDTFTARFPTTDVPFELEVTEISDDAIEWHVAENPPWWKGTTIRFELNPSEDGGTSLLFTHRGFDPEDPILEVITPAWVRFVDNLVQVTQSGRPDPAVVNAPPG